MCGGSLGQGCDEGMYCDDTDGCGHADQGGGSGTVVDGARLIRYSESGSG